MRKTVLILSLFALTACGSDTEVIVKPPDTSYLERRLYDTEKRMKEAEKTAKDALRRVEYLEVIIKEMQDKQAQN